MVPRASCVRLLRAGLVDAARVLPERPLRALRQAESPLPLLHAVLVHGQQHRADGPVAVHHSPGLWLGVPVHLRPRQPERGLPHGALHQVQAARHVELRARLHGKRTMLRSSLGVAPKHSSRIIVWTGYELCKNESVQH